MLTAYLEQQRRQSENVEGVKLITHDHLIAFYESVGFTNKGRSAVKHGPDPWYEMRCSF